MFADLILEIEKNIQHASKSADTVSERGVDWHLHHTIKVLVSICIALKESKNKSYRPRFSWVKSFILMTGYIPRGRGKSPKAFNTREKVSEEDLREMLEEAKYQLKSIEDLPSDRFFRHPYFGDFNLKQARKFIKIHSWHHLKIVRDIVRE